MNQPIEDLFEPCPFCGSDRIITWNYPTGAQLTCKECGMTTGPRNSWKKVVDAWNRRVSQPDLDALQARVDALTWELNAIADERADSPKEEKHLTPTGIALRDWFAGQAMAAALSGPPLPFDNIEIAAKFVYKMADAMLAARGDV